MNHYNPLIHGSQAAWAQKAHHHKPVVKAVTGAVKWVGNTVGKVVDTVGNTIKGALKDPLGTIAQIAAISTGQYWALPLIAGASTAIQGGSIGDVFKAVAVSYVAQKVAPIVGEKVSGALGTSVNETVAKAITSGAVSASVAVVTGQDPLQAFAAGGIGAAVPAILGKMSGPSASAFSKLPASYQQVISNAIGTQLAGGNVTASIINTALRTSEYVTNTLNDLGVAGKDSTLTPANQAILADVLYNTASAAMAGTDASNVVNNALMKAGTKALGTMADEQFNIVTGKVTEVYNSMTGQIDLISTNEANQKAILDKYNGVKTKLDGELATLDTLKADAQAKIDKFNADLTNKANYDAANAAIKAYDDAAAKINTDYTNIYKPQIDNYADQLTALSKNHEDLTSKFDALNTEFTNASNNLELAVDKTAAVVNKTVAETMDPSFNAEEYRQLNGLDSSVDAYNHWLTKGKNEGLYTNVKAASADIYAKQTGLMNSVIKSMGLDPSQISTTDLNALEDAITARYGNNLSALSTATAADVIGNKTKDQLFTDSAKTGFKGDTNTTVYGDWNKPSTTLPDGMKLATKEEFIAGLAKQYIDKDGNIISYVPDPATAPNVWSNTDGNITIKTDPVYITDKAAEVNSAVSRAYTLSSFDEAAINSVTDKAAVAAAKSLVNKAKETNNYNNITDKTLDSATKAELVKNDITSIFDFSTKNNISLEGPNTALFGGTTGGGAAPATAFKYGTVGIGGTYYLKDLTNDRVYSILNVGNSTVISDVENPEIQITLDSNQAKVLNNSLAGAKAGGLDTQLSASDAAKLAAGVSKSTGKTLAEATKIVNDQINAGSMTREEAKAALTAAGYTNPTDAEADQFVTFRTSEADAKAKAEAFADPLVTSADEVKDFFKEIGYNPSDADVAKFVGKIAETKSKTDVGTYADPLMVDATEIADAFKAMGIKYPDPADIQKFVGQYNESLLQSKIDPVKQDIQFRSLQYQLDNATGSKEAIADAEKRIQDQMAANEAAGMSRADALSKAIGDVSAELGTTTTALTSAIGTRYAGPTAADVTSINNIIASGTGGTGAQDLKYDYNGDGKVDNSDLSAIEGYLGGTGGTGTGTGAGETGFKPGAGTIWDAPTGIYGTIAESDAANAKRIAESEAANAAKIAAEAEKTRIANSASATALANQATRNQQTTNVNQLLGWLGQAEDAGGQKVTVNQSPLTQINNVYDWSSIFGTPQQQKMFVTPYAKGGTVEDLMKIMKG